MHTFTKQHQKDGGTKAITTQKQFNREIFETKFTKLKSDVSLLKMIQLLITLSMKKLNPPGLHFIRIIRFPETKYKKYLSFFNAKKCSILKNIIRGKKSKWFRNISTFFPSFHIQAQKCYSYQPQNINGKTNQS